MFLKSDVQIIRCNFSLDSVLSWIIYAGDYYIFNSQKCNQLCKYDIEIITDANMT